MNSEVKCNNHIRFFRRGVREEDMAQHQEGHRDVEVRVELRGQTEKFE